jgi:hypothetical protein
VSPNYARAPRDNEERFADLALAKRLVAGSDIWLNTPASSFHDTPPAALGGRR